MQDLSLNKDKVLPAKGGESPGEAFVVGLADYCGYLTWMKALEKKKKTQTKKEKCSFNRLR